MGVPPWIERFLSSSSPEWVFFFPPHCAMVPSFGWSTMAPPAVDVLLMVAFLQFCFPFFWKSTVGSGVVLPALFPGSHQLDHVPFWIAPLRSAFFGASSSRLWGTAGGCRVFPSCWLLLLFLPPLLYDVPFRDRDRWRPSPISARFPAVFFFSALPPRLLLPDADVQNEQALSIVTSSYQSLSFSFL